MMPLGPETDSLGPAHGVDTVVPNPAPFLAQISAPQIDSIYVRNIFLMFGSVKTNFSISQAW